MKTSFPRIATLAVLAALVLAASVTAQSNEQKLEAKKNEAWVKKSGWITDYDVARQKAKEEGKHIFAYFSRSYAP